MKRTIYIICILIRDDNIKHCPMIQKDNHLMWSIHWYSNVYRPEAMVIEHNSDTTWQIGTSILQRFSNIDLSNSAAIRIGQLPCNVQGNSFGRRVNGLYSQQLPTKRYRLSILPKGTNTLVLAGLELKSSAPESSTVPLDHTRSMYSIKKIYIDLRYESVAHTTDIYLHYIIGALIFI